MYNTNIEDNRYFVRCLSVSKCVSSEKFIVDTGAIYTCCHYRAIDKNLKEEQLSGCELKCLCGMVNGIAVKFYKYKLRQFTIGNIDLGEQYIWVTFDERVTDIILGMDILKQIILITNPYDQKIYFCKDANDYEQHFHLKVG